MRDAPEELADEGASQTEGAGWVVWVDAGGVEVVLKAVYIKFVSFADAHSTDVPAELDDEAMDVPCADARGSVLEARTAAGTHAGGDELCGVWNWAYTHVKSLVVEDCGERFVGELEGLNPRLVSHDGIGDWRSLRGESSVGVGSSWMTAGEHGARCKGFVGFSSAASHRVVDCLVDG